MTMQTELSIHHTDQNQDSLLAHVPDFYNRYPGEELCFHTCVLPGKNAAGAVLSVMLPPGLQLIEHGGSELDPACRVFVRDLEAGQVVDCHLNPEAVSENPFEINVRTRVLNPGREVFLVSTAELRDSQGELLASESARVMVRLSGSYMKHLPEIYHDSDFMGRFMMLFESFWKPISQQIDQVDAYFDPDLTPSDFLPWLGSWLGVTWDETLPEDRKRSLLHNAIALYQRRGTRGALEDYLKIYTGGQVEIIEHRAQNFVLGQGTRLGAAVALGKQNLPHTFTVNVKVDEQEIARMDARDPSRNQKAYFQKLEAIIETRKPAHTAFRLNLSVNPTKKNRHEDDRMAGKDSQ